MTVIDHDLIKWRIVFENIKIIKKGLKKDHGTK